MELQLIHRHFDFGELHYSPQSESKSSCLVEIYNPTAQTEFLVSLTVVQNAVHDFPVLLLADGWFDENDSPIDKAEKYHLLPGKKLKAKVKIQVNSKTIDINNPRTSYFKVANRCSIYYQRIEELVNLSENSEGNERPKLEFSFSANLCTSIMFIENTQLDFQEFNIHETCAQELMIWNRSESILQFTIQEIVDDSLKTEETTTIKFFEVEGDEEAPIGDRIISIPSFAPKIIQVHVYGRVLGNFRKMFMFQNKNTSFNTLELSLKGRVVSPHSDITQVLSLSESLEDSSVFLSTVDFGSCHVGVKKHKVLWMENLSPEIVKVIVELPEESEAIVSLDTSIIEKDNQSSIPPRIPPIKNYFNYIEHRYESSFTWANPKEGEDRSRRDRLTTLGSICASMFGAEAILSETSGMRLYDDWRDGNAEYVHPISNFRPLQGKIVEDEFILIQNPAIHAYSSSTPDIMKYERTPQRELIFLLKPQARISFLVEIIPQIDRYTTTIDLMRRDGGNSSNITSTNAMTATNASNRSRILDKRRDCSLTFYYDFISEDSFFRNPTNPEVISTEKLMKKTSDSKTIDILYQTSASIIEASPLNLDFGICRVSDTYSFSIHVHNCSPVTTTIMPSFASGPNELEMKKFLLLPDEQKDIPFYFFPVIEDPEYTNILILKNLENEQNTIQIRLTGQIIDAKTIQWHDHFYKLFHEDLKDHRIYGQLPLSRGIINIPNISIFKIRNVWEYEIVLQILLRKGSSIKLMDVASMMTPLEKYQELLVMGKKQQSLLEETTGTNSTSRGTDIRTYQSSTSLSLQQQFTNSPLVPKSRSIGSKSITATDIEDMKWGDRRLKHSQSLRLSIGEFSPKGTKEKTGLISNLSKEMNALDLVPNSSKTSNNSSSNKPPRPLSDFPKIPEYNNGNNSISVNTPSLAGELSTLSEEIPSEPMSRVASTADLGSGKLSGTTEEERDDQSLLNLVKFINEVAMPLIFDDSATSGSNNNNSGAGEGREASVSFALDEKGDVSTTTFGKEKKESAILKEKEKQVKTPSRSSSIQETTSIPTNTATAKELNTKIRNIQEAYRVIQSIFDYEQLEIDHQQTEMIDSMIASKNIRLKKGETRVIAILWKPTLSKQTNKGETITSTSTTSNNTINLITDAYAGKEYVKDWFQIKVKEYLPPPSPSSSPNQGLSATTTTSALEELSTLYPDYPMEQIRTILEPRMVFIREECVLSEMTIIQNNINYGRVVVGDVLSKTVTIINKSAVACLYSFSKSGSITSGFLTIAEGRKGLIEPFSTKVIEMIFKPTMPCQFEEILQLKNLLNPEDVHLITVKAKVSRAESFNLSLVNEAIANEVSFSQLFDATSEDLITEGFKKILTMIAKDQIRLTTSSSIPATVLSTVTTNQGTTGSVVDSTALPALPSTGSSEAPNNLSVLKGFAVVGRNPCLIIKFKIRNTTGKKRQFIIDGTRDDSIELLTLTSFQRELEASTSSSSSSSSSSFVKKEEIEQFNTILSENAQQFMASPDILRSILSSKCQFYSETIVRKAGSSYENEEEEIQLLMDQLEKFQQKLKINIRKKKLEKVAKYQKKIDDIILKLSGNQGVTTDGGGAGNSTTGENNTSGDREVGIIGDDPENNNYNPAQQLPPPQEVDYSELVHHLTLHPDEEKLVTVKISYFPSVAFQPWPRMLPFLGRIRIYESKNEDYIRSICFGLFLFSSLRSFDHFLNPLDTHDMSTSTLVSPTDSIMQLSPGKLPSPSDNTEEVKVEKHMEIAKHSFLIVIPPWCSHPTREAQPKYKKFPLNTLPVSIKLVKSTKDRILKGRFSVEYSDLRDGEISITLDESFTASATTGDYKAFSIKKYGELHLVSDESLYSSAPMKPSASDPILSEEMSYDLSQPSGFSFSCPRHGKHINTALRKNLALIWTPSSTVMSSPDEIRLFGLLKVSYHHPSLVLPQTLLVPFICAFQHATTIKMERYVTFENVHIGSYSTYQLEIRNTSPTKELHYIISLEPSSTSTSPESEKVGTLDILQGKTGVIPRDSDKRVPLLFTGYTLGKFEQKLWVQNINDSFDQKRLVVQANVVLVQTRFIKLPDLEFTDVSSEKYKTIDFGLVQFRSSGEKSSIGKSLSGGHLSKLTITDAAESYNPYRLRIRNVSNDSLMITIQPNLKSQCAIFRDADCQYAQKIFVISKGETLEAFIYLKPTDIEKSKNNESSTTNTTLIEPLAMQEARELQGGLRIIVSRTNDLSGEELFIENNTEISHTPAAVTPAVKKLFEVPLSFKAVVGKSNFTVRNITHMTSGLTETVGGNTNSINDVMFIASDTVSPVSQSSQSSHSQWLSSSFRGKLELSNQSKRFPLRYQILDFSNTVTFLPSEEENEVIPTPPLESDIHLFLRTEATGSLFPMETRTISFMIMMKNTSSVFGLHTKQLLFYNCDTNERHHLDLFFYIQSKRIICQFYHTQTPITQLLSQVIDDKVGDHREREISKEDKLLSTPQPVMIPDYPLGEKIWVKTTLAKHADLPIHQLINNGDIPGLEKAFSEKLLRLEVAQSTDILLGTMVVTNTTTRTLSLVPMSELPIYVLVESQVEEETRTSATSASTATTNKDNNTGNDSTLAVTTTGIVNTTTSSHKEENTFHFGQKNRKLKRCGHPFLLKPNSEVKIFLKISIREIERPLFTDTQFRLLLQGRTITIQGLFCLLENVSKLQSMFLPPPSTSTTSTSTANTTVPTTTQTPITSVNTPITATASYNSPSVTHPSSTVESNNTSQPNEKGTGIIEEKKSQELPSLGALYLCNLCCQLICPRIIIDPLSFDLGLIRWNARPTFTCKMKNVSSVEVLCALEPVPEWLTIEIVKYKDSNESPIPVLPELVVMPSYEYQDHNAEKFLFFLLEGKMQYELQFQINLAGRFPENLTSQVYQPVMLKLFSKQITNHPSRKEANFTMTSLPYTAFSQYPLEIRFLIDNRSMLEISVPAPTILTTLKRENMMQSIAAGVKGSSSNVLDGETNEEESMVAQTLPSTISRNTQAVIVNKRLECLFNEYFVVPAPTRLDPTTMNALLRKIWEANTLTTSVELDSSPQQIYEIPIELHRKFSFLSQTYTFWLKNTAKESVDVMVELVMNELLSDALVISFKIEDNNNNNMEVRKEGEDSTSSNRGLKRSDLSSGGSNSTGNNASRRKLRLQVGESISMSMKISVNYSSRFSIEQMERLQQLYSMNQELLNISTLSAAAAAASASLSAQNNSQQVVTLSNNAGQKAITRLQQIIQRLRRFRIGPCLFGTLKLTTSPVNQSKDYSGDTTAIVNSFPASVEEEMESNEYTEIDLRGSIALGATVYLLPPKEFPLKPNTKSSSSKISAATTAATTTSTPDQYSQSSTSTTSGHISTSEPLNKQVFMYQDKKGYWHTSFPATRIMNEPISLSEPYLPSTCLQLCMKAHTFYLVNLANEPFHYCSTSPSYRFPGLNLLLQETLAETIPDLERVSYYTDCISLVLEPKEGIIPPHSMQAVSIRIQSACASEANLYDASDIFNRYFREEYQRFLYTYQPPPPPPANTSTNEGGEATEEPLSSLSSTAMIRSHYYQEQLLNKFCILTLPLHIWDQKWLLHPPLVMYINITCDEDIPMITSSPLTIMHRSEAHLGGYSSVNKYSTTSLALSSNPSVGDLKTTTDSQGTGDPLQNVDNMSMTSERTTGDYFLAPSQPLTPNRSASMSFADPGPPPPPPTIPTFPIIDEIQSCLVEKEKTRAMISSNRNMMISPMMIELADPSDEIEYGDSIPKALSSIRTPVMNLRGITPYTPEAIAANPSSLSSLHRFGVIDLGKQSMKEEWIEWMITIENHGKSYLLEFEIYEYSINNTLPGGEISSTVVTPGTTDMDLLVRNRAGGEYNTAESWLLIGRNSGLVLPLHATSLMFYFNRAISGKYLSYLMIKSKIIRYPEAERMKGDAMNPTEMWEETYYIKATYEIIPNEKNRRPSMTVTSLPSSLSSPAEGGRSLQELFPLTRELSGFSWKVLYMKWFTKYFSFDTKNYTRRLSDSPPVIALESSFTTPILLSRKSKESKSQLLIRNLTMLDMQLTMECTIDTICLPLLHVDIVSEDSDLEIVSRNEEGRISIVLAFQEYEMKTLEIRCSITEEGERVESTYPINDFLPIGMITVRSNWIDNIEYSIPLFLAQEPK